MRIPKLLFVLAMVGFLAACSQQNSSSEGSSSIEEANGNKADGDETDGPIPGPSEEDWHTYYTGSLDDKIEIVLELYGQNDAVRGTITYKKTGVPITVLGSYREDDLWLKEFQADGLVTGTISAKIEYGRMSGKWYGDKEGVEYDLKMTASHPPKGGQEWPYEAPATVAGKYEYHFPPVETGDPGAQGVLTVKQNGDMVTFAFDCVSSPPGYNMAVIEDTEAPLEGNTVFYHSTEYGDCEFRIKFFKGFATVEHLSGHVECGFGNAAGIEGQYIKIK